MKHFMVDRRTFISTLAIACLAGLGFYQQADVYMPIATIAGALAAANAYERGQKKQNVYRSED